MQNKIAEGLAINERITKQNEEITISDDIVVDEGGAFDDFDAFGTIGRGRVINPRYQFRVKKTRGFMGLGDVTYEVVAVKFACTITDLYDFNYEDGNIPARAATMQIGYGAGACDERTKHGRIFAHSIEVQIDYLDPFEYHTTMQME